MRYDALKTFDGAVHQYSGRVLAAEGVRAAFSRRYGARVVYTTPRSLDRREPAAIEDALVDLWLLRDTGFLVGSASSSVSEMAAFGRNVPVTVCRAESWSRHITPLRYWLNDETRLKWTLRYYWRLIRPRGAH